MLYRLLENIREQWKVALVIMGGTLVLTLIFTFVQPLEYRSDARLLIIYTQIDRFDPYLFVKAEERLAESLGQIVFSSSFVNKVKNSQYTFPQEFFPLDPIKLSKQWDKMVSVDTVPRSGLLRIHVYHADKQLSLRLSSAIADVLVSDASEYHGAGDKVVVKVVDAPVATDHPVRPNILLNIGVGILVGFFIGLLYIFLNLEYETEMGMLKVFSHSQNPVPRRAPFPPSYSPTPTAREFTPASEAPSVFEPVQEDDSAGEDVITLDVAPEHREKVDWQKNGSVHRIVLNRELDS